MEAKYTSNLMQVLTMNNGVNIPMLGFGTFGIPDDKCNEYFLQAINCGYRHFDTAQIYGNEAGVGRAIQACGVLREELFITTKVWVKNYGFEKTLDSVERSLEKLQTEYVDLLLLHRPFFDYKGAWKALEKVYADGRAKAIGLSNFNEKQTQEILDIANVRPAVNQIELHPYFVRKELKNYLAANKIDVEAWSPLGHGNKKLLEDKLFKELSKKYEKTASQIILRWHIQSGNIVFPKTCSEEHMRENMDIFSFELSAEDVDRINKLDKNKTVYKTPDWIQKIMARF